MPVLLSGGSLACCDLAHSASGNLRNVEEFLECLILNTRTFCLV